MPDDTFVIETRPPPIAFPDPIKGFFRKWIEAQPIIKPCLILRNDAGFAGFFRAPEAHTRVKRGEEGKIQRKKRRAKTFLAHKTINYFGNP